MDNGIENQIDHYELVFITCIVRMAGYPMMRLICVLQRSIFPSHASKPFYSSVLHIKTTELQFSDIIMEVAKKYSSKKVSIGSYPVRKNQ